MNLAAYPRIDEEIATVRFIIDGLGAHPHFKDAARSLRLAGFYGSIKTLQDHLLGEEAAILAAPQFQPTPNQNLANAPKPRPSGRSGGWRGRGKICKPSYKRHHQKKLKPYCISKR